MLSRYVDVVALLCPSRTRESSKWQFDLGVQYGNMVNALLGKIYGKNKNNPISSAASSQRRYLDKVQTAQVRVKPQPSNKKPA